LNEGERRGELAVGMKADMSILELTDEDIVFSTPQSNVRLEGKKSLVPRFTLKSRAAVVEIIPARPKE
jgi:predicted amidohydrolase